MVRTRSQAILILMVGLITSIALLNVKADSGRRGSVVTSAVGFALAGAALIIGVRLARCAVIIQSDGFLVRNPIRTIFLPWSTSESFRVGRRGLLRRVCIVSCRDRPDVVIFGVQGRGPAFKLSTDPVNSLIAQLNDAVRLRGHTEQ